MDDEFNVKSEDLIRAVSRLPVLWDRSDPAHRDRGRVSVAWRQIARALIGYDAFDELGETEKKDLEVHLTKKWNNLKDSWVKSEKRSRFHGESSKKKKYKYSDLMSFLKDDGSNSKTELQRMEHEQTEELQTEQDQAEGLQTEQRLQTEQLHTEQQQQDSYIITYTDLASESCEVVEEAPINHLFAASADESPLVYVAVDSAVSEEVNPTLKKVDSAPERVRLKRRAVDEQIKGKQNKKTKVENAAIEDSNKEGRKKTRAEQVDEQILKLLDRCAAPKAKKNRFMSFFESLLPVLDKFDERDALRFQMGVLTLVKEINGEQSTKVAIQSAQGNIIFLK